MHIRLSLVHNAWFPMASVVSPLNEMIVSGHDLPPVWSATGKGRDRGIELTVFHRVAKSVMKFPDQYFYELLALIDAVQSVVGEGERGVLG